MAKRYLVHLTDEARLDNTVFYDKVGEEFIVYDTTHGDYYHSDSNTYLSEDDIIIISELEMD